MDAGKIVKIRFKRYFSSQKLWIFVGEVLEFTETWVKINGKGIIFTSGQLEPFNIDEEARSLLVPRDNIAHIRILPEDFDIEKIEIYRDKNRWYIKVANAPDASLGEMGETV